MGGGAVNRAKHRRIVSPPVSRRSIETSFPGESVTLQLGPRLPPFAWKCHGSLTGSGKGERGRFSSVTDAVAVAISVFTPAFHSRVSDAFPCGRAECSKVASDGDLPRKFKR